MVITIPKTSAEIGTPIVLSSFCKYLKKFSRRISFVEDRLIEVVVARDDNGKTISFTNAIIIATSNAGSEFIRESLINNTDISSKTLLDYLQKNAIFAPELLNRFDDIIVFKPLNPSEISQIAKLLLSGLASKMSAQDIVLNFDQRAIERIAQGGFSEEFGARPLARYIQDNVEDVIAKKILSGEINRGDKVLVSVDPGSNLVINKTT